MILLYTTIEKHLTIPREVDIMVELKDDEDYIYFRREYTALYNNMIFIPYLNQLIITSINEKFNNIRNGQTNLYEAEHALYLLNVYQIHLKTNDYNSDIVKQLASNLFNTSLMEINSEIILTLYFETLVKYQILILSNQEILIYVIKLFLSKNGILNENIKIGVKICNIFDKFLDKAKTFLNDVKDEIVNTLKYLLDLLVNSKNFCLIIDYGVIFHSLSLVVTRSKGVSDMVYKDIFTVFENIFKIYGVEEDKFNEVSKLITHYLKGFSTEIQDKTIFIEFLNKYYNEFYLTVSNSHKCKYSMITILQRFITILGKDSVQYVEYFLFDQINFPSIEIYEDSIKLLQNSAQILKANSKQLIKKTFYLFYLSIRNINLPTSDVSDEEKTILNIYSNFVKLIQNITTDLVEVLFEGIDKINLEELFNFLSFIGTEMIDITVRLFNLGKEKHHQIIQINCKLRCCQFSQHE
jgi:hypothetical protein